MPLLNYWFNIGSIHDTIRPFYYFAKIFGYAPFTIVRHADEHKVEKVKIIVKITDILHLIFMQIIYSSVIYCNVYNEIIHTMKMPKLFITGSWVILKVEGSLCVIISLFSFFIRGKIEKFLNKLAEVDNQVRN